MSFIKISIPIIIILLGSIDLVKAVVAQKDDEMKKAQAIFIKRLIYGIAVFFVISIVAFLIGLVGGDTNNRCFKCVANVYDEEGCDKDNIPVCRKETPIVETPNEEPQPQEPEIPNDEPCTKKNIETKPAKNGCRVNFSGVTLAPGTFKLYKITETYSYVNEYDYPWKGGTILGEGSYIVGEHEWLMDVNKKTFDSVLVDSNTKLKIERIIHNQCTELLNVTGPIAIFNSEVNGNDLKEPMADRNVAIYSDWSSDIGIPKDKRIYSEGQMHAWLPDDAVVTITCNN